MNTSSNENIEIDPVLISDEQLKSEYDATINEIKERKNNLLSLVTKKFYRKRDTSAEHCLTADFNCSDIYAALKEIANYLNEEEYKINISFDTLNYETLFSDKVKNIFSKEDIQEQIKQYEETYQKLLDKSNYLNAWGSKFDHRNLDTIKDVLAKNRFFEAKGELTLTGKDQEQKKFSNKSEMIEFLQKEKERVINSEELKNVFEKINRLLDKNEDTKKIDDVFQMFPELITEYSDIDKFKKKAWVNLFRDHEDLLLEVNDVYEKSKSIIDEIVQKAKSEEREWKIVLDEFKDRFQVPFDIDIKNQQNVICHNDAPVLSFSFRKGERIIPKDDIDELRKNVLSEGEARAYGLLKMLFVVNAFKSKDQRRLLVFDDVADSFDYKNKYAIVEYINDISNIRDSTGKETLFTVLLLTHNFDFYRTVSSRLNVGNKQLFFASSDYDGNVTLEEGNYTNNYFKYVKSKLHSDKRMIITIIPFLRNIIEYCYGTNNKDYLLLTNLLHCKSDTKEYNIREINEICKKYFGDGNLIPDEYLDMNYYEFLINTADEIPNKECADLENKVILSIAIRLITEDYILQQLEIKEKGFGDKEKLVYKYKDLIKNIPEKKHIVQILNEVSLMTPENIHLNSFMYEPILDLSLRSLYILYAKVKCLMWPNNVGEVQALPSLR